MKLKRLKTFKYNFFKMCFLIFGNQNSSGANFYNDNSESNFKSLLKIIYNFHYSRKKLLFIVPKYLYEKKYSVSIINSYHHVFLKEALVNGFICNRKYVLRNEVVYGSKNFRKFAEIDAVIIFDVVKKDRGLLNELNSLDIPIICFGISDQKSFEKNFSFFGCPQKINNKNLEFYWFLISLLIKR